jgi:hypothetical protein
MHYKSMFDASEYLFAYDLDAKDVTVQIASVSAGSITGKDGRKAKKPMVVFRGSPKKLALNKTNGSIIAKLYGPNTKAWVGKWITLYPTTTSFGGEVVECIRIRPTVPTPPRKGATDEPPTEVEAGGEP